RIHEGRGEDPDEREGAGDVEIGDAVAAVAAPALPADKRDRGGQGQQQRAGQRQRQVQGQEEPGQGQRRERDQESGGEAGLRTNGSGAAASGQVLRWAAHGRSCPAVFLVPGDRVRLHLNPGNERLIVYLL